MKKEKLFIVFLLVLLIACSPGGTVLSISSGGAVKIDNSDYLIGGILAQGEEGDILIYNNYIRAIIKTKNNSSFFPLQGNIIDADIRRIKGYKGQDSLGFTGIYYMPNHYPEYEEPQIIDDGTLTGIVQVQVKGTDSYNPIVDLMPAGETIAVNSQNLALNITTDYYLEPESNFIKVVVSFRNNSNSDITIYPGILVNPGPGKTFAGGSKTGFFNPLINSSTIAHVEYLSKETNNNIYGFYLGSLLGDKPEDLFSYNNTISLKNNLLLYSPLSGAKPKSDIIEKNSEKSFKFYFYVNKGYSGTFYKDLLKLLNKNNLSFFGNSCYSSSSNIKVCDPANLQTTYLPETDIVIVKDYNGEFYPIIHDKTDDNGHFEYELNADDTYKVIGIKRGYGSPTTPFWELDTDTSKKSEKYTSDSTLDFVFNKPYTLKIFSKKDENESTVSRITIIGKEIYPASISQYISAIDFNKSDYYLKKGIKESIYSVTYTDKDGKAFINLPAGKYEIIGDKGMEYNIVDKQIDLTCDTTELLKFTKVLNTGDYEAIDMSVNGYSYSTIFSNPDNLLASITATAIPNIIMLSNNMTPVTQEVIDGVNIINGTELNLPIGNFAVFPSDDFTLITNNDLTCPTPAELFKSATDGKAKVEVLDPSDNSSYFYSLGLTTDFKNGAVTSETIPGYFKNSNKKISYSNAYNDIEILKANNLEFNLKKWFQILQISDNSPIATAGSHTIDELLSYPGNIRTYAKTSVTDGIDYGFTTGNIIVSKNIFFTVSLAATTTTDKAVPGGILTIDPRNEKKIKLTFNIQSPLWAEFNKITIFNSKQNYSDTVTNIITNSYSFTITPTVIQIGLENFQSRYQWTGTINYPYSLTSTSDDWVVVMITGNKPVKIYPKDKPIAISNPIFIDSDNSSTRGYNAICPGSDCPIK